MNKNNIRIAAPRGIERLACALRNHLHINAGFGFERGQEMIEEARILRRCGRGNGDGLVLRLSTKSQAGNVQSGKEKPHHSVLHNKIATQKG